jgi:uncharacterized protein (TIGR02646 family)
MKKITKKPTPPDFESWKEHYLANNGKTLEGIIADPSTTGRALWGCLRSQELVDEKKEEGKHHYSKQQLRTELHREQGGICCYCNAPIVSLSNDDCNIEHFKAKGLPENFQFCFDYTNLLLSCNGGRSNPPPREDKLHCDAKRKEKDSLPFSPADNDYNHEEYFTFSEFGNIIGFNPQANEMISKLALNIEFLNEARKGAIRAYLYENSFAENPVLVEKEKAMEYIATLSNLQADNTFTPFGVAIVSVLKKEFNLP